MSVLKPVETPVVDENKVQAPIAPQGTIAPTVSPDPRIAQLTTMFTEFEATIIKLKNLLVDAGNLGLLPPGIASVTNALNKTDEAYLWFRNVMHML